MKNRTIAILLIIMLNVNIAYAEISKVLFSPKGGIRNDIITQIKSAKKEILVQAYVFTDKKIANELITKKNEGLNIIVILDKSNLKYKYSALKLLTDNNIITYIDDQHPIAHNKIIIIDNNKVLTGSYNFTTSADTKNAENYLVIENDDITINKFINNFNLHKDHSMCQK